MRIVCGLLGPDGGEVRWRGTPPDRAARRRFGYMPEERGLYARMRAADQLAYLAELRGRPRAEARAAALSWLERLGLAERADEPIERLSLGNQQRVQLAAALVHQPELLVLDEPFSGLDPLAVDVVVQVLRERAAAGVPVLFSSHQLDVVERLCDDLVIIADGMIRAAGPRERLRGEHTLPRYRLLVDGDAGWLRDVPGVTLLDLDGDCAVFELAPGTDDQDILRAALARGPVRSFGPVIPTLSEIFREVIR
jgi:ABC-2 type transport system ATP-binding protein